MSGAARRASIAAAVALIGLACAAHPLAWLAWLALVAPALGALAASLPLALALALPLAWCLPLAGPAGEALPTPWWGLCVVFGLYGAGLACGAWTRERRAACCGLLLLATLALSTLPARGAWARSVWPPALASALFDLSPTALAMEAAGADWMRHASVYEPVGSDRFERRARRGSLAGPTLLLVGYATALAAGLAARRRVARA